MARKVVIFNFSPRYHGNCEKVSKLLGEFYSKERVQEFQFAADTIRPCGNCNYECLNLEAICPNRTNELVEAMDAACDADIVYFIVPNICGWPSANYFAFNERTVGYFNLDRQLSAKYQAVKKRFIVISNSEGSHFVEALQSQTKDQPRILYLKTGKYHKRSTFGDLMEDPDARAELMEFLAVDHSS